MGILSGIRIVEICDDIAGAFGGQICADRGAEVVKIEPLSGNSLRHENKHRATESKLFQSLNRGKQSVALDFETTAAREVLADLIRMSDGVILQGDTSSCRALGMNAAKARKINAQAVVVDISYFGEEGEWAGRNANDLVLQAFSGMLAGEGKRLPDGAPKNIVSTRMAEYCTGYVTALGISTGLLARERTGKGALARTSQLKNLLCLQSGRISDNPAADLRKADIINNIKQLRADGAGFPALQEARVRATTIPGVVYYRPFTTKDGSIFMGALSRPLRDKARRALETDYLHRDDPDFDPGNPEYVAYCNAQQKKIEDHVCTKTTNEWMEIFTREGVPAGPVVFPEDLSTNEQVLANQYVVEVDHEVDGTQIQVAPHAQFGRFSLSANLAGAPSLGRDTDKYLELLSSRSEDKSGEAEGSPN